MHGKFSYDNVVTGPIYLNISENHMEIYSTGDIHISEYEIKKNYNLKRLCSEVDLVESGIWSISHS